MDQMMSILDAVNGVLWHEYVLYIVLGTGVIFTIWSGLCQYHSLTHGVQVTRGKYDDKNDPGAINHFQALSTALSATVGLGNIGGVALAIALGGPGAVFWMWMVGLFGMALKMTEVTLAMLYRNTDEKDNPHGGPMWVAAEGFKKMGLGWFGRLVGVIFCITLLISSVTGGNMFQAWNVAEITHSYFPSVPQFTAGVILMLLVSMVILGGIKRIGAVAGMLVPFMCLTYLAAAAYVLIVHIGDVPAMLKLIFVSAFTPANSTGAFLGGTAGYAFLWGMKRALFSSESGQGSAPIAHSAAKTDEPVREGVVSGLEPFIDTIVVCTLTTLVILLSGAWDRGPEATFAPEPGLVQADHLKVTDKGKDRDLYGVVVSQTDSQIKFLNGSPRIGEDSYRTWAGSSVTALGKAENRWIPDAMEAPEKTEAATKISGPWKEENTVFMILDGETDRDTGRNLHRLHGTLVEVEGALHVNWVPFEAATKPKMDDAGLYNDFVGAALTGHAFDRVLPGLGMWLVTLACWLFALSTIISWYYYGEQGVIFMVGKGGVLPFKVLYCILILISTLGFIKTDAQLDAFTALGTGVMLFANIPIMLIFGSQAMKAYHDYFRRLKSGEMDPPHAAPRFEDVMEGKDVE